MRPPDRLEGERVLLRAHTHADVRELVALRRRNRDFLGPYEPARSEAFFTDTGQRAEVRRDIDEWLADRMYAFAICERGSGAIRGRVGLSNVVRGAWENCTLGYFLDQEVGGRGLATEAVALALAFAFGPARLHRVQAAVMPHNARSRRVLEKNGFRLEGFSPRYLRLDDDWRDHDVFAITVEEWSASGSSPGP